MYETVLLYKSPWKNAREVVGMFLILPGRMPEICIFLARLRTLSLNQYLSLPSVNPLTSSQGFEVSRI